MKRRIRIALLAVASVTGLLGQQGSINNNLFTVVPKSDLSSVGELRFRDKQSTPHYTGWASQNSNASNIIWRMPNLNAVGCLSSDGATPPITSWITCGGSYYQRVQSNTTNQTQRTNLNFTSAFSVSDSAGSDRTTIDLSTTFPSGISISVPVFVEYIGAVCQNATATLGFSSPTSNPATAVCLTGTNTQLGAAQFTATTQTIQGRFILPDDWVSGSGNDLEFRFDDASDTNTGHNEVWNASTACIANTGASVDPSFNTAQTASVSVQGTANRSNTVTLSTFTTTGCSAGNMFFFKVGLDSSRTATGNANLLSIRFKLKRTVTTL